MEFFLFPFKAYFLSLKAAAVKLSECGKKALLFFLFDRLNVFFELFVRRDVRRAL